jgi:hypothetical protein
MEKGESFTPIVDLLVQHQQGRRHCEKRETQLRFKGIISRLVEILFDKLDTV